MNPDIQLDRYDLAILRQLQKDADISNQELADRIGLSASPCLRRVKQLEAQGLIRKKVALLDANKLGFKLTALIQIAMDKHTPERFENFENHVLNYPEVQACYLITGQSADYIVKVVVPDMEHFQQFLLGKLTRIEGVSGVHSSFVMRKVIDSAAVPI